MVVLTPAAVEVVSALTTGAGMSGQAGLRIAAPEAPPAEGGMQVELVPEPAQDDQVLDTGEAKLYLDDAAASYLDDKVLHVEVDEQGAAHFTMAPQNPDTMTTDGQP